MSCNVVAVSNVHNSERTMSGKLSRTALVGWVNNILQLNVTKVDDFGTGAVYCQLLDSIYGDLPMQRVRFGSKSALDIEQNYKILQQAFTRHNINRSIDTARLMKCRLQDNLDFTQWMYAFWHENPHIPNYDPVARRRPDSASSRNVSSSLRMRDSVSDLSRQSSRVGSVMSARRETSRASFSSLASGSSTFLQGNLTPKAPKSGSNQLVSDLQNQIRDLEAENDEFRRSVDVLVEERGLYYDKLLDIETLVNEQLNEIYSAQGDNAGMDFSKDPLVILLRQIQEILFSSPEGFQPQVRPEDEPF